MRATWILGCSAVLALAALPASAQPVVAAKSGTISVADGKVFLDDKPLDVQPGQFPDMKEKSVLRTEEGRAEVLLPPGMFLRVGENTSFRMVSNRLVDTRIELLSGSGVVEIDANSKDAQVTLLCKDGTVTFTKGIYRFDAQPARLKVFEGSANVDIDGRSLAVSSGKLIGLTGDTASVERFDVKDTDSLDHWSRRRGEEVSMANVSAAKRASGSSWSGGFNPCLGGGMGGAFSPYSGGYGSGYYPSAYALGPGTMGGAWAYNPWYGMITYMPCSGMLMSPYGYGFWSPYSVGRLFYGYGGGLFGRGYGYGYGGGYGSGGTVSRGIGYPTNRTSGGGTFSGVLSHSSGGVGSVGGFGGGSGGGVGAASSAASGASGGGASMGHSSGGGGTGGFGGGHGGGGHH